MWRWVRVWGHNGDDHWLRTALRALRALGEEERRAGARAKKAYQPQHPAPANLRGPEAVKDALKDVVPMPTDLTSREEWERTKLQLVLDKLADGTKRSYSVGWRWWVLFCRAREAEPIRDVNEGNRKEEEAMLLDFVVHLAKHGHKSVGTIKQFLSSV